MAEFFGTLNGCRVSIRPEDTLAEIIAAIPDTWDGEVDIWMRAEFIGILHPRAGLLKQGKIC